MAKLNSYLNFMGNTEEAFNFYKSVFGGDFANITRFKDMPDAAGRIPENEKNKIMHIALPIGNGSVLMGTDALESMGHKITNGNNFHICIDVASKDEADKIYNKLSADGKVTMPIGTAPWGAYFGMFNDKYGVQWMVNYDQNQR